MEPMKGFLGRILLPDCWRHNAQGSDWVGNRLSRGATCGRRPQRAAKPLPVAVVVASTEPLRPSSSAKVTTIVIRAVSVGPAKDGAQCPKLSLPESNRSSVAPGLTRIGVVQQLEPVLLVTIPFIDDWMFWIVAPLLPLVSDSLNLGLKKNAPDLSKLVVTKNPDTVTIATGVGDTNTVVEGTIGEPQTKTNRVSGNNATMVKAACKAMLPEAWFR
jgi:hypothetical protein